MSQSDSLKTKPCDGEWNYNDSSRKSSKHVFQIQKVNVGDGQEYSNCMFYDSIQIQNWQELGGQNLILTAGIAEPFIPFMMLQVHHIKTYIAPTSDC